MYAGLTIKQNDGSCMAAELRIMVTLSELEVKPCEKALAKVLARRRPL